MRPGRAEYLWLALVTAVSGAVLLLLLSSEAPYGAVVGTLITADQGSPLAGVRVELVASGRETQEYSATTGPRGTFAFRHVVAANYRLLAHTQAHREPTDLVEVKEGATTRLAVELQPTQPFLNLMEHRSVFTTREEPSVRCYGFSPADELVVRLYQVQPDSWVHDFQTWQSDRTLRLSPADFDAMPSVKHCATQQVKIAGRNAEGVFHQVLRVGQQPPGGYVVAVQSDRVRTVMVLTVTDLGLIVKSGNDGLVAYAVDLNTGGPVPGASVTAQGGRPRGPRAAAPVGPTAIGSWVTDANGRASLGPQPHSNGEYTAVVAHSGSSTAYAAVMGGFDEQVKPLRVYTYTDRPLYRPGQRVYFKSILREIKADAYQVASARDLKVQVRDERENLVFASALRSNNFGSASGHLDLSSGAAPGQYEISLAVGGHTYEHDFTVAAYRKPEYDVTVTPGRDRFVAGEDFQALISVQYFYGMPVARAKVTYTLTRTTQWSGPDEYDADLQNEEQEYGENVAEGQGRTDAQGHLQVSLPTRREKDQPEDWEADYRYKLKANVEVENREAEGSGAAVVTQGDLKLELTPDRSVAAPGQPVSVSVSAGDYSQRPAAGLRGQARLVSVHWSAPGDRRSSGDDFGPGPPLPSADRMQSETTESTAPWQTDARGTAQVQLTPRRQGDYRIVFETRDQRGRALRFSTDLWSEAGKTADFDYPYEEIDVRADRKLYQVGQTAHILVNTKYAPTLALLTVEGDRVMDQRWVRLGGKSTLLPVTVRPEYLPGVHLQVSLIHDKRLLSGEALLNISRDLRALRVEVTPAQAVYQPGDLASFSVKTLSPEGRPVPAEVSLGVVDKALYALQPDDTTEIAKFFYPRRENRVETTSSFAEVYLSGDDKGSGAIPTRRLFLDTAYWTPSLVTDSSGQAQVSFRLPDNLTTWRATCRAATLDTRVGQGTCDTIVQKPFLVRLEAPRFLTQGDQTEMAAIVHNLTSQSVTATVGLEGERLTSRHPGTVSCRVAAGETRRVAWTVSVPSAGPRRVRVWVQAGSLADAMELTLPTLAYGRQHLETRAGSVPPRASLWFAARQDLVPGSQRLVLRFTPSLVGAVLGSLDYLAEYPYGCVEQTVSCFLPDLVVARMLASNHLEDADLKQRLPGMVQAGLLKLYGLQHEDGAWGWWEHDQSDPWMTSYALFGLLQAKADGYPVTQKALNEGLQALAEMSHKPPPAPEAQAFMAYVLALGGQTGPATDLANRLLTSSHTGGLPEGARGFLALALSKLGRTPEGQALASQTVGYCVTHERGSCPNEEAALALLAGATLSPPDPRLPDLARQVLELRQGNHWESTRDTAFMLYALAAYCGAVHELEPNLAARVTLQGQPVLARSFGAGDLFKPELELVLPADKLLHGGAVALEATGTGRLYYTASWEQEVSADLSVPVDSGAGLRVERDYRTVSTVQADAGADRPGVSDPRTSFALGEVVEVTLTLRATQAADHLMLEDMLPAGLEPQDQGENDQEEWSNWWAQQIVRDDRVAFAVAHLEPGVKRLKYYLRAQTAGRFIALPPRIYDMYDPRRQAEGVADTITVSP